MSSGIARRSAEPMCSVPAGLTRAKGYIKNVNTIEEFKNTDKTAMIADAGRQVCIQGLTVVSC